MSPLFALYDGASAQALPLTNRGFAYGDGLFETIRVEHHRAQFLELHLQRLLRDSARLHINVDAMALRMEIDRLLDQHAHGVLKITVTRASPPRGYFAPANAGSERVLQFFPQQFPTDERARNGVALRLCRQQLSEQPALAGIKHLNRLEQVLARREWSDASIAEGLVFDSAGRLIEGTMTNVFLVRGNILFTPRLHRCGVAGVMRAVVLTQLAPDVVEAVQTDLLPDDLMAADEVFVTNSIIGIWPVNKIECLLKPIGPVTLALQEKLNRLSP